MQCSLVESIRLDVENSTLRKTPYLDTPLYKDLNGDPPSGNFSYASVVRMLLYLAGHSQPYIVYSVFQVTRFSFAPQRLHKQALKLLGWYLLGTCDKELVLTPSGELYVDMYPDADFAEIYGYKDKLDPVCVRSRTGSIVCVVNYHILWQLCLQTKH